MPQPLSKIAPDANPKFSALAIDERPSLAPLVASIFCKSAWIEYQQSLMLVRLTGGSSDAAIAMFEALESDRARGQLLNAAAQASLDSIIYSVFEVVNIAVRKTEKERNKFAHHVWATCDDLQESILLIPPEELGKQEKHLKRMLVASLSGRFDEITTLPEINKSKILVYEKDDLARIIHRDGVVLGFRVGSPGVTGCGRC